MKRLVFIVWKVSCQTNENAAKIRIALLMSLFASACIVVLTQNQGNDQTTAEKNREVQIAVRIGATLVKESTLVLSDHM